MNPDPTRRLFIRRTTEAATLLTAASTLGAVHGFAANQPATVRMGIIGCGGIMGRHIKGLVGRHEAVSLAWLCDIDPAQIEKAARLIDGFQPAPPKRTGRFEDVLDDKDVDACIIATAAYRRAGVAGTVKNAEATFDVMRIVVIGVYTVNGLERSMPTEFFTLIPRQGEEGTVGQRP